LVLSIQNGTGLLPVALLLSATLAGAFLSGRHIERTMRALGRDIAEKEDYKRFVENAPQGFIRMDEDGRFLEINTSLARICGFDTVEQFYENVNADPRALYAEPQVHADLAMQLHVTGSVTDFLAKIRRRDGREIWTSQDIRAIYTSDGAIRFFEGTLLDID